MSEQTSAEALKTLDSKGVKVMLNRKVTDYVDGCAIFDDGRASRPRT
ncbi:MAG: hypothetical protein ACLUEV_01295 [Alistipes sp.]